MSRRGFHVVVRRKGHYHRYGYASEMPLRSGWQDVEGGDFGFWRVDPDDFNPFMDVLDRARNLTLKLNGDVNQ